MLRMLYMLRNNQNQPNELFHSTKSNQISCFVLFQITKSNWINYFDLFHITDDNSDKNENSDEDANDECVASITYNQLLLCFILCLNKSDLPYLAKYVTSIAPYCTE